MNLRDVILNSAAIHPDLVLYALKTGDQLLPSSEVVLLELTEEEFDGDTEEIANARCPGFSYCMEMFLMHELIGEMAKDVSADQKVERVIHYIEYDA